MEDLYSAYHGKESKMVRIQAGLHLPEFRYATISAHINERLRAYLIGDGADGFVRGTQCCVNLLINPPFITLERNSLSIPVGVYMLRYETSRSRDIPAHSITKLGTTFLDFCGQVLRGEDPVGDAGEEVRCTYGWTYTSRVIEQDRYALLQIDVPGDVTCDRFRAYVDKLMRYLRTRLSDVGRTPARILCPEDGGAIGPGMIHVDGRIASAGAKQVIGQMDQLIAKVWADLGA